MKSQVCIADDEVEFRQAEDRTDQRQCGGGGGVKSNNRKIVKAMQKILYIDMDNVLVDFPSGARGRLKAGVWEQYEGNQDEIPDVFSLMDPMPGAIAAYAKQLSQVFDTYVLSTAPWENHTAWRDKLLWIKKYLGTHAYKRLILTHHKNLNQGDYLVDDRTKNGLPIALRVSISTSAPKNFPTGWQ